uniref:Putative tail protein n=1 Tax=viral metagenome TaxID=1070528 RepID=A0A6M3J1V0_9ZZZZ
MLGGLPVSGLSLELRNFSQFQSQISRAESLVTALGDATSKTVTQSQRYVRVLGTAGIALGAIGAAALASLAPIVKASATLERLQLMGAGVAKAMGISTKALADERAELNRLDAARSQSYKVLNGLILQNIDYTKSSDLVAAALDMAAFQGMDVTRVMEDYAAAVENATMSTLRQYGISAASDAVFSSHARAIGKVASELTQYERRQAVLNYVLQVSTRIGGAYQASLTTQEGLLRRTSLLLQRLRESLGMALAPTIITVLEKLNRLVEQFTDLPQPVQATITKVLALTAGIGLLAGMLTIVLPGLKVLAAAFVALPGVLTGTSTALATATSAGAKFGIIAMGAKVKIAGMAAAITGLGPVALGAIGAVSLLVTAIATNFGGLGDLVKKIAKDVGASIAQIWHDLKIWGTAVYELVKAVVVKPFLWADTQIRRITGRLSDHNFGFTWDVGKFFLGGAQIMASFALGILQGVNKYVLPTLIGVLETISRFLIGASPPPEGPLSKIDVGGVKLIQAWLQGMASVSLDAVYRIVDEVGAQLTKALWKTQDMLFDIETGEFTLDKALWPLEDQLTRVRAAADLVTIPLERQRRVLQAQLEDVQALAEAQRHAAEARLRELEQQTAMFQELVDADRGRLEVMQHEIFMEQMRNRILGQVTSARLITLRSAALVQADKVSQEEAGLKASQEAEKLEKQGLQTLVTAAEAQQAIMEEHISRLTTLINLELERVTYAEEEIRLLQATQVESRLAALEERRFWEEEERLISHMLDILGRVPSQLKDATIDAAKEIIEDWERIIGGDFVLPDVIFDPDRSSIEEAKRRLAEIFEPVRAEFAKTQALWDTLKFEWKNLVVTLEVKWAEDPSAIFEALGREYVQWSDSAIRALEDWSDRAGVTIVEWGRTAAGDIATWAQTSATTFAQWRRKTVPVFQAWVVDTIQSIGEWITTTSTNYQEWAADNKETLESWNEQTVQGIQDWVRNTTERFTRWSKDVWATFSAWGEDVIRTLSNWGTTTWQGFWDWIEAVKGAFLGWAALVWQTIIAWGEDTWQTFITWGTNTIGTFKQWALDAYSALTVWLDFVKVTALAKLQILVNAMSTWWKDYGLPAIAQHGKDAASKLIASANALMTEKVEDIKAIGKSLVSGLKTGISDAWGGLETWVKGKVDALIKLIKSVTGAFSPSRKTIPIGVALVQGLESGFNVELLRFASRIQPKMDYVLGGLMRSVQGVGGGSQVSNNYYYTTAGPTISVAAQYPNQQSPASIRDDIGLMLALAR